MGSFLPSSFHVRLPIHRPVGVTRAIIINMTCVPRKDVHVRTQGQRNWLRRIETDV
jgi:hypothetical protein